MNYLETIDAWLNLIETDSTEIDIAKLWPRVIEATELKIYRDMDFLYTIQSDTSLLVAGNRNVTIPTDIFIVRSANVITPATATDPDDGVRVPLTRVSNEFLDAVYGSSVTAGVPKYYAMLTDTECLLGPKPDAAYTTEFIGTYRPAPLSPTNATNFLTLNMPDLYIASGMIFLSSYYQNYGAAADDPKMAVSWTDVYSKTLAGINLETIRQKAASYSWTAYQPTPAANTPRERASGGPA